MFKAVRGEDIYWMVIRRGNSIAKFSKDDKKEIAKHCREWVKEYDR